MTVLAKIGSYRQVVTLAAYTTAVADGDGGFAQSLVALDPEEWRCAIEIASASSELRHFNGTVIAQATHVLRGRFHSGITTDTRAQWTDRAGQIRTANVIGVVDVEGAGVETIVAAVEQTDPVPPESSGWVAGGWTA